MQPSFANSPGETSRVRPVLVSVIVPTYNRLASLKRTLRSVLQQTVSDIEILIVDDGSTDGTEACIAREFVDPRIVYLRHVANAGVGPARNTGIDAAKGEFIAFLDSDDVWMPHKLETQILAIRASAAPNSAVCYSAYLGDFGSFSKRMPRRGIRRREDLGDYLFRSGLVVLTSTVVVPRALIGSLRFERLAIGEDTSFFLDLRRAGGEFVFVEEPLCIYSCKPAPDRLSLAPKASDLDAARRRLQPKISGRAYGGLKTMLYVHGSAKAGSRTARILASLVVVRGLVSSFLSPRNGIGMLAMLLLPTGLNRLGQRVRVAAIGEGLGRRQLSGRRR